MKVVIASGIFPPDIGGPATSASVLASAWAEKGCSVEVVTYSDIPQGGEASLYRIRRILRSQSRWRRTLAYLAALWDASKDARVIFAQDGASSGLPAWIVARLRGRRLIVRLPGDFAWENAQVRIGYSESLETFQKDDRLPPRYRILRVLQRFIFRQADRVVAPSLYLANLARSWGVTTERITIIPNGVEFGDSPLGDRPHSVRPHDIVAAGRLVPWKRFDVLIKAMVSVLARVPDATLTIAGDGPEEARLKDLAAAAMLQGRVRFVGRMKKHDLQQTISGAGAFALVSSYEGFSHQLVEAMAAGAPVVASRAGGNPEIVEDGVNGLLVPVGDVDGTAAALIRMLTDRALSDRCRSAARETAGSFSVERQIEETTTAVFGAPGLRVLMISRDGGVTVPGSRTAERLRRYAAETVSLDVIAIARAAERSASLAENASATVIDTRRGPWALLSAIRLARRAVWAADVNLVVAQDPFEAGLIGWFAARAAHCPLLIEEHGGVFLSPHWRQEQLKNRLLYPLGWIMLRSATSLRAVSHKIGEDLRERFPKKRVVEIPVYTEPLDCRSEGAPATFGYLGRFVAQKNLPMLLAAFVTVAGRIPSARLIMKGTGPLEDDLRSLAAGYGIAERIAWQPYGESVEDAYGAIGTFVLPSWYEGWGRVAIESLMCGIPVVMTDVGCAGEIVRDGVEGRVTPVGDKDAFAKAMLAVAEPGRHGILAAAARHRAESFPTPDMLATALTTFWKEVAGV